MNKESINFDFFDFAFCSTQLPLKLITSKTLRRRCVRTVEHKDGNEA